VPFLIVYMATKILISEPPTRQNGIECGEGGKGVCDGGREILIVCHTSSNSRITTSGRLLSKIARNCPPHTCSN